MPLIAIKKAFVSTLALTLAVLCSAPAPAQDEEYALYRSRGYAQLVAIDGQGEIDLIQETADTLLPLEEAVLVEDTLFQILEEETGEIFYHPLIFELEETDSGFVGRQSDGTVRYFDALDETPDKLLFLEEDLNPVTNFEVFSQLIEENYAYFELSDLNWQEVYDTYRPQITETTTPDQLFDVFAAVLARMDDGHGGSLKAPDLDRAYSAPVERPSIWMVERSDEIFGLIEAQTDSGFNFYGNGRMLAATFDEGRVGYLNILSFVGFSDRLVFDEEVFAQELDRALVALSSTEALIIDLRWNFGGLIGPPLALANRFTDQIRLSHQKQARFGDGFTEPEPVFLEPQGASYLGRPVSVLISDLTLSSGDVAAGNLGLLPNVTLVGRNTWGGFSNLLQTHLPNTWEITFSNERYLWGDGGVDLERVGIVPDIVEWPSSEALDQGRDNTLERALTELEVTDDGDDCTPGPDRLCLWQDRFAVEVSWGDFQGGSGVGRAVEMTDETGHFWFFDPNNVELVVKVIDGTPINGHFWVFFGSLTNVQMTLTVTDTETGAVKTYQNPAGQFAGRGDTQAFAR